MSFVINKDVTVDLTVIVNHPLFGNVLHTLLITVVIFFLRRMVGNRMILDRDMDQSEKRKWMVAVKNIAFFIWLFAIVVIWIQQLQSIGATVVVFAAAIVVATKEFILNIVGYLFRSSAKPFSIGDRIEVNAVRGDVLDQNITGVTLLEVGSGVKTHQYTGSSVFIPNAVFLSALVKNETLMGGDYVFHIITLNLKMTDDWQTAEAALLNAAQAVCRPYFDQANRQMTYLSKKHALDQPGVEPRINIQIPEHDKVTLQLRMPVPTKRRGRIEADVLRAYLMIQEENKAKYADTKKVSPERAEEIPE